MIKVPIKKTHKLQENVLDDTMKIQYTKVNLNDKITCVFHEYISKLARSGRNGK